MYIKYKSNGNNNKTVSVKEYLNKTRPYLKEIKNNLKKCDTGKVQLAIESNFIFSIDNIEEHVMHSKSDKWWSRWSYRWTFWFIKKKISK